MSIRILLAHSEPIAREGLHKLLVAHGLEIVATPHSLAGVRAALEGGAPDVILIGPSFPDGDILQGMQSIRGTHPRLPILVFAPFEQAAWLARSVALGASGCVTGESTGEELVATLRSVAAGESVWRRDQLRRVTPGLAHATVSNEPDVHLTGRETDVLLELCKGSTNRQIAELLGISYETVKEHVQHLLHKIGVEDRTQAAVWAVRRGMIA